MVKYCMLFFFFFTSLNTQMLIYHIYKVWVKIQLKWKVFMVLYFMEHGEHSGFLIFIPCYGLIILKYFFCSLSSWACSYIYVFSLGRLYLTSIFNQTGNFTFIPERKKNRPSSLELRCVYLYVCPFLILISILIKSRIWDLDI